MTERSGGWVALWAWRGLLALVSGAAAYRIGAAGYGADLLLVLFGVVMIHREQCNAEHQARCKASPECYCSTGGKA